VGTADHGHVDAQRTIEVEPPDGLVVGGDSRVLHLRGEPALLETWASGIPGLFVRRQEVESAWGPEPRHPAFEDRAPDVLVFAEEGSAYSYPGNDIPLVGHHGGLTPEEVGIPLLVGDRGT
jgi:hypothetical protein